MSTGPSRHSARSRHPGSRTPANEETARMAERLLDVKNLKTYFFTDEGVVRAVDGVDLYINQGETLGIVGESGCGKSVTALSIMRLIPQPPGQILYNGLDLVTIPANKLRKIRGKEISMVFQEPMTSLNPVFTCGEQIAEALRLHEGLGRRDAMDKTVEMMKLVHIANAERRVKEYPHQFSGGMRQRVMIAMALSCSPDLLIADEPTTALDVTIQAQILNLIKKLKQDFGSAVVLITHDMGVVADIADRVAVMYAGRVVEQGSKHDLFYDAQHPYTWGLLGSIARLDRPRPRRLTAIKGMPPSLISLPEGCSFGPRCPQRWERCAERPELPDKAGNGHLDACHLTLAQKRDRREVTIHPELSG